MRILGLLTTGAVLGLALIAATALDVVPTGGSGLPAVLALTTGFVVVGSIMTEGTAANTGGQAGDERHVASGGRS